MLIFVDFTVKEYFPIIIRQYFPGLKSYFQESRENLWHRREQQRELKSLYSAVLHIAVQCSAAHAGAVRCSAVQHMPVRCSAVQCSTCQCSAAPMPVEDLSHYSVECKSAKPSN